MPSMPREPKPPGTMMPSALESRPAAFPSSVSSSLSIQSMSTSASLAMPPWVRLSTTDR